MIRIGVDFGGTKIEAAALDADGAFAGAGAPAQSRRLRGARWRRCASWWPRPSGRPASAGATRRRRHAGLALAEDRPDAQRQQRLAERQAVPGGPGAGAGPRRCGWRTTPTASRSPRRSTARARGAEVVFGAILGTGCGGGVVVRGRTVEGVNRIGGEWGHTPLPWPQRRGARRARLLVRPRRLPGDLDLRHRPSARDYERGDRRDADRRRDRRRARGPASAAADGGAGPLRRPAGPRRWR